jgi:hypothetical protein
VPSPKEIQQIISNASLREGSPFVLLKHIINEGETAEKLVDQELLPEIVLAVRNGYLNLDAVDEGVICSAFASIISRKITSIMATQSDSKKGQKNYTGILMRAVDKTISLSANSFNGGSSDKKGKPETFKADSSGIRSEQGYNPNLMPISRQWCTELKVFLKVHSVSLD